MDGKAITSLGHDLSSFRRHSIFTLSAASENVRARLLDRWVFDNVTAIVSSTKTGEHGSSEYI
jgi:hypothetical protein